MSLMHPTPSRLLADALLGNSLEQYVTEKRSGRPKWAWSDIADQLAEDTDGRVRVSRETLRRWFDVDAEQVA